MNMCDTEYEEYEAETMISVQMVNEQHARINATLAKKAERRKRDEAARAAYMAEQRRMRINKLYDAAVCITVASIAIFVMLAMAVAFM